MDMVLSGVCSVSRLCCDTHLWPGGPPLWDTAPPPTSVSSGSPAGCSPAAVGSPEWSPLCRESLRGQRHHSHSQFSLNDQKQTLHLKNILLWLLTQEEITLYARWAQFMLKHQCCRSTNGPHQIQGYDWQPSVNWPTTVNRFLGHVLYDVLMASERCVIFRKHVQMSSLSNYVIPTAYINLCVSCFSHWGPEVVFMLLVLDRKTCKRWQNVVSHKTVTLF